MSRLKDRDQDRTYIELHVAELQRMTHATMGTRKIATDQPDLINDTANALDVVTAVSRMQAVLGRGVDRFVSTGTGLDNALADALSRVLDLAERCNIDLGEALADRLMGGG